MKAPCKTVYLCGAGGKGNVGAEAITLAIIKLFQNRYKDVRFILTSWYPERVEAILSRLDGNFAKVKKESVFNNPLELRKADFFVICGDVSISETVVSFLPLYYGLRILAAKLLGVKTILLGIEAEKVSKWYNIFAIKRLIGKTGVRYILRNEESYENLEKLPVHPSTLLLGCEPSLTLHDSYFEGFGYHNSSISDSKLLVGFGLRDHFTKPFKVNLLTGKLERRDALPGQLTDEMKRIIEFTARIGDYLVEKYDAQLLFIPHHYLAGEDKVIMTDSEVAEKVIAQMRHPKEVVRIEDNLHPFTILTLYKRLDLVFSMRHHANSFACYHHIPTFGYRISEKIVNFFKHLRREDLLIDPMSENIDEIKERIDRAIEERDGISADIEQKMGVLRNQMSRALDSALGQAIRPGPEPLNRCSHRETPLRGEVAQAD